MGTEVVPVDRVELSDRLQVVMENWDSLQDSEWAPRLTEAVFRMRGEDGKVDIATLPEDDAKGLLDLCDIVVYDSGYRWGDPPGE
jgi:hypothetical protein